MIFNSENTRIEEIVDSCIWYNNFSVSPQWTSNTGHSALSENEFVYIYLICLIKENYDATTIYCKNKWGIT